MEIKSKIVKSENVKWKELEWLQGDLKSISRTSFERLKQSLMKNQFRDPFKVWEGEGKTWILDGHHRKKALEELETEGVKIPAELPGIFIECENIEEAHKLVLVYSSTYANIGNESLQSFVKQHEIDTKFLVTEIDLPKVDIQKFLDKYISPEVHNNQNCQYPIVQKFGENYNYVVILCQNEVDWAFLKSAMNIKKHKSYKSDQVGEAHVIKFEEFSKLWKLK